MTSLTCKIGTFVVVTILITVASTASQDKTATNKDSAPQPFTANYPQDEPGVFIQAKDWTSIPATMPAKSRVKHGVAAAFSYGAVPADLVSEYDGLHAQVRIEPGRPVICICHLFTLPGAPALVRLHPNPKKNLRELDGGRMPVIGAKMADAAKNDLIAADISQPEKTVWLVRPQQDLPAGEYALMLGTSNVNLFAFTVAVASGDPGSPPPTKH
jgi:hypothetical protein